MESTKYEYQQHHYLTEYKQSSIGKRLIIIGEAQSGPLHEPIKVYNRKMAEAIFKSGPLVERVKDIIDQSGQIEMHVMRIESEEFIYAMDIIKTLDFDLLVLDSLEFHEDNKFEIEHYVNMAYEKANTGRLIHAFFKVREFENINELYGVFNMIEELTAKVGIEIYEFGKYLSVIADQLAGVDTSATYASLIAGLGVGESPVNKPIKAGLRKHLTKDEIRLLRDKGLVCFKDSYHNGTVCCSPTCAVATLGSYHKNITNYRIVQYIINEISEGLSELVGSTVRSGTISNAEKLVQYVLERNVREGILKEYDYEIRIEALDGLMYVTVAMVPIFTVEKIVTHSQIRILK